MSDSGRISRRDWLRGRFFSRAAQHGVEALDPVAAKQGPTGGSGSGPTASPRYRKSFPVLRPPGAVEEERFLDECTRCNACIDACPPRAIKHAPARFRRAAGTPMIDPIGQPCWMCSDFPCIAACQPGVLRSDLPVRMGTVRIDITCCTAHQGGSCDACAESCPVAGALEIDQGRPRIVADVCTGCGVCQHVCPAPQNAILLLPLADRPVPDPDNGEEQ